MSERFEMIFVVAEFGFVLFFLGVEFFNFWMIRRVVRYRGLLF